MLLISSLRRNILTHEERHVTVYFLSHLFWTGSVSTSFNSCPSDIVAYTYNRQLGIPITWEVPTAVVGSSGNPATVSCSRQPGNFFLGQQTVICTATDGVSLTSASSECSFVVSVEGK